MRFAKEELKEYPISEVCRVIGVSRSNYYRMPVHKDSEKTAIEKAVVHCFYAHDRNYGRIRLRKELAKQGIELSEYRINRIMKQNQLEAKGGRPRTGKRNKKSELQYVEENLIKDKFSVTAANYLWCSDITEIEYKHGKLYLCCVIDVGTRRIVGWSIDRNQRQGLVQDAFQMAVGRNPDRPDDAIYHSDRGSQYTAKKTKKMVEAAGFRKSMSRPGTPSDNQPIESFWRTLKVEIGSLKQDTYAHSCNKIKRYIEMYYNASRMHSGISYYIPNELFTLLSVSHS